MPGIYAQRKLEWSYLLARGRVWDVLGAPPCEMHEPPRRYSLLVAFSGPRALAFFFQTEKAWALAPGL